MCVTGLPVEGRVDMVSDHTEDSVVLVPFARACAAVGAVLAAHRYRHSIQHLDDDERIS